MRTAGFSDRLYSGSSCDSFDLYLTDVSGWGTWRNSGGLKITTFFVLLVFASELQELASCQCCRERTIAPRTVQNPLVSLLSFDELLNKLILLGITAKAVHPLSTSYLKPFSALVPVDVTAVDSDLGNWLSVLSYHLCLWDSGLPCLLTADYHQKRKDMIHY